MKPENDFQLSTANQNTGPDIKKYIFKGLSYWYLFVIFIPAAYIIATVSNRYIIPAYGLHTTILLKTGSGEEEFAGGLRMFSRTKNMNTEIGLLKSYKLNKQALDSLDWQATYFQKNRWRTDKELYKNTPFIVEFDTAFSQYNHMQVDIEILSEEQYKLTIEAFELTKKLNFNENFQHENFKFKLKKSPQFFNNNSIGKTYYFYKNNINQLINSYKSKLKVELSPEESSILWLWVVGRTPAKDADYLNTLSEIFIQRGLKEKNAKAQSIIEFIDRQLSGVQDSLAKNQNRLQLLKEQSKTLNISSEAEMLLTQKTETEQKLNELSNQNEYYKYMLEEIKSDNFEALVSPGIVGINDNILNEYLQEISEVLTEKNLLNFDLKSEIPKSKKLDYRINQSRNKIKLHIERVQSLNIQKTEDARSELARINQQINRLPASERNIINTQRVFDINDNIYTLLLTRRTEAAITQASNKADSEVLDRAMPENAVNHTPASSSNTRKALLIGALLPILIIVLIEFLNNKIEERSDIENHTDIPILSTIINNAQKTENPVLKFEKSPVSESFRTLRTNLMFVLTGEDSKTITVSSTVSGEGKTFMAQNLASVLSISEKRTLLVGLDLRKPKLQKTFDYFNNKGMSTYLSRNNTFPEIIKPTDNPYLDIALSGPVPPNPAELIESEEMQIFIEEAKKQYHYIVIDTPPIAVVTDALLLTELSDAFLYVVRQNYSSKNVLKIAKEVKEKAKLRNLMIILNDANTGLGYGYKYNYGYGRGYYAEDVEAESKLKNIIKRLFRKT
jgi:capsular exopolysaccharide synthesis family protein